MGGPAGAKSNQFVLDTNSDCSKTQVFLFLFCLFFGYGDVINQGWL